MGGSLAGTLGSIPNELSTGVAPLLQESSSETLWRRALEEARGRLKILQERDASTNERVPLQEQVMKLSVALAETRAREGEQLTHLATLSNERAGLRAERGRLLALLKSTQALLDQQNAHVAAQERARTKELSVPATTSSRARGAGARSARRKANRAPVNYTSPMRKRSKARKPK